MRAIVQSLKKLLNLKVKRMNKLEYIPGDLVMTNGVPLGTSKNVAYRVTSSDPSKTLELDDGTVTKGVVCLENIEGAEFGEKGYLLGDCCAWVKDIVPIPITQKFYVRINGKQMILTMIIASMISYTFVRSQQKGKQAVLN